MIARCRNLLPLGGYLRAYRMHTMGLHRACMRGRVCVLRGNAAASAYPPPRSPSSIHPPSFPPRQATKESIDCVTEAQARTNNAAVVATPFERTIQTDCVLLAFSRPPLRSAPRRSPILAISLLPPRAERQPAFPPVIRPFVFLDSILKILTS